MAGNRIQYTIGFTADTRSAEKSLSNLNKKLQAVTKVNLDTSSRVKIFEDASYAAQELQKHLQAATNVNTGKLNLNAFNESLKVSNTNLKTLLTTLANGGEAGNAAFLQFANAIAQSEAPLKRTNTLLAQFGNTLKSTIKYQLSLQVVQGITRSISSAINYAKDLNGILTDIRVVTGNSVESMAQFTQQANKAAKELSVSTKDYAKASLIYYQQGDNAEEVARKAAITVKAANVAFTASAQEMSEMLTAVWNSYQVGEDELERYVDIMAALGTKTATSTEEIAGAMQKVAATANVVGVSMEQMASIIATVSSITREAPESIGTSYKTILARIGDLKLGKTLDDGVTLGKVSSTLKQVGINVLDANKNLRDMGIVIEEIGQKWNTFTTAQQTAIAQVVGGKRQYTQWLALMDNFNTYQENLNIANNAEGTLESQAKIYEQSWEAATKRVQASLETLYGNLINDQSVIGIVNNVQKLVDGITAFIDALGGVKTILPAIGVLGIRVFSSQIASGILGATENIKNFFSSFQNGGKRISPYIQNLQSIKTILSNLSTTEWDIGDKTAISNAERLIDLKVQLAEKNAFLTSSQKQAGQAIITSLSQEIDMVNQLAVAYEQSAVALDDVTKKGTQKIIQYNPNSTESFKQQSQRNLNTYLNQTNDSELKSWAIKQSQGAGTYGLLNSFGSMATDVSSYDIIAKKMDEIAKSGDSATSKVEQLQSQLRSLKDIVGESGGTAANNQFKELQKDMANLKPEELQQRLETLFQTINQNKFGVSGITEYRQRLEALGLSGSQVQEVLDMIATAANKTGNSLYNSANSVDHLSDSYKRAQKSIQALNTTLNRGVTATSNIASSFMSMSMAFSSFKSLTQNGASNIVESLGRVAGGVIGITSSIGSMSRALETMPMTPKTRLILTAITAGAAIISAISGAISGDQEAQKQEQQEKLNNSVSTTTSQLSSLQEESEKTKTLWNNYNQLRLEYLKTGEVSQELSDATLALAESYGITNNAIVQTEEQLDILHKKILSVTQATLQQNKANLSYYYYRTIDQLGQGQDLVTNKNGLGDLLPALDSSIFLFNDWKEAAKYSGSDSPQLSFKQGGEYSTLMWVADKSAASKYQAYGTAYGKNSNISFGYLGAESKLGQSSIPIYYDPTEQHFYDADSGALLDDVIYKNVNYAFSSPFTNLPDSERWQLGFSQGAIDINYKQEYIQDALNALQNSQTLADALDNLHDIYGNTENGAKSIVSILSQIFTDNNVKTNSNFLSALSNSQFAREYNQTNPDSQLTAEDWLNILNDFLAEGKYTINGYEYKANNTIDLYDFLSKIGLLDYQNTSLGSDFVSNIYQKVATDFSAFTSSARQLKAQEIFQNIGLTSDALMNIFQDANGENVFDENGDLKFFSAEGEDQLAAYEAIEEAQAHLVKVRILVQDSLELYGENSPQYAFLKQYLDYLDGLGTIYEQIIGENTQASIKIKPLIKARNQMKEYDLEDDIIDLIKNNTDKIQQINAILEFIENQDDETKKQLGLKVGPEYTEKDYIESRNEFINSIVQMYNTDNADFDELFLALEGQLEKYGVKNIDDFDLGTLINKLSEAGITTLADMTTSIWGTIINAVISSLDTGKQVNWNDLILPPNELDTSPMKNRFLSFSEDIGKYTSNSEAAKNLGMTLFDLEGNANPELAAMLEENGIEALTQDAFLSKNAADQKKYLETIQKLYQKKTEEELQKQVDNARQVYDSLDVVDMGEGKPPLALGYYNFFYGAAAKNLSASDPLFSKYKEYSIGPQSELLDENGEEVQFVGNSTLEMLRFALLSQQNLEKARSDVENAINEQQGFTIQHGSTSTVRSDTQKGLAELTEAQEKISALQTAISDFQDGGKLENSTKSLLSRVGIDPTTIETAQDAINKIKELQRIARYNKFNNQDLIKASGLTEEKVANLFDEHGALKSFDSLNPDWGITEDEYNAVKQALEYRQKILDLDTHELEILNQQTEAQKRLNAEISQHQRELTREQQKASTATSAYEAISGSIGKSYLSAETIAKARAAGVNVDNWSNDTLIQQKILQDAAFRSYEAELAVLEKGKIDPNILMTDEEIAAAKSQAMRVQVKGAHGRLISSPNTALANEIALGPEKAINKALAENKLDDGEIARIIELFFGKANAATKQKIQEYLSSLSQGEIFSLNDMIDSLKADQILNDNEITELKAKIQDGLISALDTIEEHNKQVAQSVVNTWMAAFDAILKVKEGLAQGKTIAEALFGDEDSLAALITNYLNLNPDQTLQDAFNWLDLKDGSNQALVVEPWNGKQWSEAKQGIQSVYNEDEGRVIKNSLEWQTYIDKRAGAQFDKYVQMAESGEQLSDEIKDILNKGRDAYIAQERAKATEQDNGDWGKAFNRAIGQYGAAEKTYLDSQRESKITEYGNAYNEKIRNLDETSSGYDTLREAINNSEKNNTSLREEIGEDNLQTLLNQINSGRAEDEQLTLDQLLIATLEQVNEWQNQLANDYIREGETLDKNLEADNLTGSYSARELQETAADNTATALDKIRNPARGLKELIGTLSEAVGMNKDEFKQYTQELIDNGTITAETEVAQYRQAKSLARVQSGLKTIRDTTKTWTKDLKENKGDIIKTNKTLSEMRSAFENVLDASKGSLNNLSEEFMTSAETAKLLKDAMDGDEAAYNKLQAEVAKEIAIGENVTISPALEAAINTISAEMDNLPVNQPIVLGELASISPQLYAALNEYVSSIAAAGGDVQAAAESLGFNLEYTTLEVPMSSWDVKYTPGNTFSTRDGTFTSVNSTFNEKANNYTVTAVKAVTNKGTKGGNIGGSTPKTSGGGGSKAKKLDKKDPEDEIERYHHVNKTIDRLSNQLDEVDKKKSRIYGKSYLDYISQEIALTEKQCDTYQRYIDEAKEYLKLDTERVVSLGAIFDEYGNIANYDQVMQNILDAYNAFIDEYNAMDADTQQSEEVEQRKEDWDKWYDEKKKWIENYEETVQTIYEQNNNLLDAQNKISEKMLEGIQYKVEIHVELTDAEKEYLDYVNDKYEEILMKQGEAMSNLVKETDLTVSNLAALGKEKEELDAAFASGKLNQANYVDGLKDLNSQVLDNLSTLQELKTSIEEFYGTTLETATSDFDKQTAKVKAASEAMSSYISILALVGKGSNLKELTKFYDSQYQYNLQSLQMQQEYLNTLKKEEQYYLERMNSAEGLTETERKQYEALEETLNNVQSNILSDTQSTLQAIAEAFNNEVEIIISDLEKMIAGSDSSLQDLADAYSYYQEEQDRYVTSARELYEVNKLNRNIEKTMATTTSTVNKNLLAALQERINKQSEENELTEYNVEMNQLQYELLLKKIALEEAQNAKNTVRLTRDAGGNYVYQYTANQEDILSKEQEYEDVLQQINDLSVNRVRDLESQLLQIYQNTTQKMREIAEDQTLTEEEKYAKIQTLMDQFKEQTNYIQEQYNIASAHLIKSNEVISEHYNKALVEHSQNAQNGLNQTIAKMIENTQQFQQTMEDACTNKIPSAMDQMKERIDSVTETTNSSYGSMADSLDNYNKVAEDAVDQNNKIADGLENEVLPAIHDITTAWDEYAAKLKEVINVYEEMYQTIIKTLQAQGKLSNAEELKSQVQNQGNSSSNGGLTDGTPDTKEDSKTSDGNGGGSGSDGSGSTKKYTGYEVSGDYYNQGQWTRITQKFDASNFGSLSEARRHAEETINTSKNLQIDGVNVWKNLRYMAYATGGIADFTGPAWLDGTKSKPELVLNSGDTQNLLAAVESVRKLDSSTLRLLNNYIANASLAMTFGLSNMSAQSVLGGVDTLRQDVHITAEFPNATNSQEIEDAFDSLINRAAQFITTKN